jgi:hypothetical protein
MSDITSTPLENSKSTPLALSTQVRRCNQYAQTKLAIERYNTNGRGITYTDLLEAGLAEHKSQAQDMLKYHLRNGTLFTLEAKRPQQYYPTAIKSDIIENLQKSTQIDPTGVASSNSPSISKYPLSNCVDISLLLTLLALLLYAVPLGWLECITYFKKCKRN